jgi:hypothetical protein
MNEPGERQKSINAGHVDHVCFAYKTVDSQDKARQEFSTLLGLNDWDDMVVVKRNLRVLISWGGGLELIAPIGPGSILDAYFEKNSPGFYSLAFGVDTLEKAMEHFEQHGRVSKRTTGQHEQPSLMERFDVFKQSLVEGPVGGVKLILAEHRGFHPKASVEAASGKS